MTTTLMIHSSGLSGRQWSRLVDRLPGPCLTPDLNGYPEGPEWTGGAAMEADLQLLTELLDAQLEPVDLIGHSYGGSLVFLLALRRPERVRRIVVHEPVLWGALLSDGPDELKGAVDVFAKSGFIGAEDGGGERWMEAFVDYWNVPGAWAAMTEGHRRAFLAVGPKVFAEVMDLFHERRPASLFDTLRHPTLITMGDGTTLEEQAVCRALAARLPSRTLRALEGGHMLPLSHARAFNEVVAEFLGRPLAVPPGDPTG